jgi:hypothetical protein
LDFIIGQEYLAASFVIFPPPHFVSGPPSCDLRKPLLAIENLSSPWPGQEAGPRCGGREIRHRREIGYAAFSIRMIGTGVAMNLLSRSQIQGARGEGGFHALLHPHDDLNVLGDVHHIRVRANQATGL